MNTDTINRVPLDVSIQKIKDRIWEDNFTALKVKINTLLWEELPDSTTLARAEKIACDVMGMIIYERDKAEGKSGEGASK